MAGGADRPYFKSSISELEALFNKAQSDLEALQVLDHELRYRATDRAARLRTRVTDALAALSVRQISTAAGGASKASSPAGRTVAVIAFSKSSIRQPPSSAPKQGKTPASAAVPPTEDLGELLSFPIPKSANEPTASLAAWTALEALSPQTYRRPEDLDAGDRRCVADLSAGRVPWGTGERSRPKKLLYYQVILGSIPMERATEDLVKAFEEDEERSPHARGEKAAIARSSSTRMGSSSKKTASPCRALLGRCRCP